MLKLETNKTCPICGEALRLRTEGLCCRKCGETPLFQEREGLEVYVRNANVKMMQKDRFQYAVWNIRPIPHITYEDGSRTAVFSWTPEETDSLEETLHLGSLVRKAAEKIA